MESPDAVHLLVDIPHIQVFLRLVVRNDDWVFDAHDDVDLDVIVIVNDFTTPINRILKVQILVGASINE